MRFFNESVANVLIIIFGLAIVFASAKDMKQAVSFIGLMVIGIGVAKVSMRYK